MSIKPPAIKPEKQQLTELTDSGVKSLPYWLKNGIDKSTVDFCEKFGYCLAQFIEKYNHKGEPIIKTLSSSQIRKVYGEDKRIEMRVGENDQNLDNYRSDLLLLKPKMAYSAKRDKTFPAECLYQIIKCSIDTIDGIENDEEKRKCFDNFCDLFEAIIAYHRAYEK
ncbi:MAG: type III-A CRISPR-associated protein Csm2 [Candidatus Marinimicrobia bacterium]|nr:type III-A CRISPR-associated protein Csm2 [Candidatus Neomarinimicrobiota bacterium]